MAFIVLPKHPMPQIPLTKSELADLNEPRHPGIRAPPACLARYARRNPEDVRRP